MAQNYYGILGVTADATQEQIKSAYRQKVKELHPDYYGVDREPFLSVQKAYAVLGDPVRRRAYDDTFGGDWRTRRRRRSYAPEPLLRPRPVQVEPLIPPKSPVEDSEDISLSRSFLTFRPSFEELFERLWRNFTPVPHPKAEAAESLTVEIPLTAEQAQRGGRLRLLIPAQSVCPNCGGRGQIGFFRCGDCAGTGAIRGEFPVVVTFPAGITNSYLTDISLEQFGIRNFYLTVYFRVSHPTW